MEAPPIWQQEKEKMETFFTRPATSPLCLHYLERRLLRVKVLRMFDYGNMIAGKSEFSRDFAEWFEHESPMQHARVGNFQQTVIMPDIPECENVDIDHPWNIDARTAIATEVELDALRLIVQLLWCACILKGDDAVEKVR